MEQLLVNHELGSTAVLVVALWGGVADDIAAPSPVGFRTVYG